MNRVELRTVTGRAIDVISEQVTYTAQDGIGMRAGVHVRVRVTWSTWQQIMDMGAFHLDDVDPPSGFEADQEVLITLRLRDPLTPEDIENHTDELGAALSDPNSPLSHTESWRCTEIMQSVQAPQGRAEVGIRTQWASQLGPQDLFAPDGVVDLVTNTLSHLGQEYEIHDGDLIRFTARPDQERSWLVLITLDRDANVGTVFSVHPRRVPAAARAGIAKLLLEANHKIGAGAFEIDEQDGEVRYRLALTNPTMATFSEGLNLNITTMAAYYDAIRSAS